MFLVATLCDSRAIAMKILEEVPDKSIVLLPETVEILGKTLVPLSKQKDLFIIYNQDIKIDDKWYIAFHGIDKGEYKFRVRKFNLWDSDIEYGYTPSEPEPFVSIRNHPASLFICYDCAKIYQLKDQLINHKTEILMISANWQFNFNFLDQITNFALKYIPTLKYCILSNTNTLSFIKTRTEEKRITKPGYVKLGINEVRFSKNGL